MTKMNKSQTARNTVIVINKKNSDEYACFKPFSCTKTMETREHTVEHDLDWLLLAATAIMIIGRDDKSTLLRSCKVQSHFAWKISFRII